MIKYPSLNDPVRTYTITPYYRKASYEMTYTMTDQEKQNIRDFVSKMDENGRVAFLAGLDEKSRKELLLSQ